MLPAGSAKALVEENCTICHNLRNIVNSNKSQEDWQNTVNMMKAAGAPIDDAQAEQIKAYLIANFPEKPRPKPAVIAGAVQLKFQIWTVPTPGSRPHDPLATPDGALWWSGQFANRLGRLDPKTGEMKEYPIPVRGGPHGLINDKDGNIWMEMGGGLSKLDPATGELRTWRLPDPTRPFIHEILPTADGSVWLTIEAQNKVARFDPRTEKFQVFGDKYDAIVPQLEANAPWPELRNTPGDQTGAPRRHTAVADLQGNIWSSGRPLAKLDPKTGEFKFFPEVPDCYGIAVDKEGNVWFAEFNSRDHHSIGKVDVATNKITKWTPPNPGATPRRLKIDSKGMVWFGDYFGGNLTRFDPKAQTFKVFKLPGPMPTPYGVAIDHNDNIWYASMYTDVMGQLDPRTGKVTEYPSPYGEKGTRDMTEDSEGRIWYGAQPYFRVGYIRLRTESEKPVAQIR